MLLSFHSADIYSEPSAIPVRRDPPVNKNNNKDFDLVKFTS